jgi:hypothetical protein
MRDVTSTDTQMNDSTAKMICFLRSPSVLSDQRGSEQLLACPWCLPACGQKRLQQKSLKGWRGNGRGRRSYIMSDAGLMGRILISLAKYSYIALKSSATKLYCIILYHLVSSCIIQNPNSLGTSRKVRMRSEGLKAHAYAHFIKSSSRFIIKYQYYRAVVTGKRKTRRAKRSLQTIARILSRTVTCNSSLHPGSRCRL